MSHALSEPLAGVLLAAGRGRRMGATKQLMPITPPGGTPTTMVAAAFDLIAPACDGRLVVVTGHEASRVAAALAPRAFIEAASDPDADMFHSVRVGLSRARHEFPDVRAYWLHLADHPLVRPRTVESVLRSFHESGASLAIMPEHEGRGGHPVIIPAGIVDDILAWGGDGGLRAFWLGHPERCRRIATDDAGATRDIDTPEQYRDMQQLS
jgi:molybdenum cofactor cytidylyltransferase